MESRRLPDFHSSARPVGGRPRGGGIFWFLLFLFLLVQAARFMSSGR
jgi:hypothetical protein